MSEHTKGRLVARDLWLVPADQATRPIGGSTNKEQDRDHYANVIATVREKYHDGNANAHRLAAAWNNAEGMDTQEIEQGMPLVKVRDTINAQARELNAARALLREVLDHDEAAMRKKGLGLAQPGHIDRIRSYLDACDTLEGKK